MNKDLHIERNISAFSSHSLPYCVVDSNGKVVIRCRSKRIASNYIKEQKKPKTNGHLIDDYQ